MNLNFFEAIFDRNFADKMGNINELREVEGWTLREVSGLPGL
jgi:hypothetical protein